MELRIAEKLKELRRDRGNTQEDIANHLGISVQAISKWERGEGLPDITMLPGIASYYDVTVDTLLGCDEIKRLEKIGMFEKQCHELLNKGKSDDRLALCRRMEKEFPNDETVLYQLMYALLNVNRIDNSSEIIKIANKLLTSANNDYRYGAIQSLCFTYNAIGDNEKAVEYARMVPDNEDLLVHVLKGNELVEHCQWYFWRICDEFGQKLEYLIQCNESGYTAEQRYQMRKILYDMYHMVFSDGDFGFWSERLGRLCYGMALALAELGENDRALSELEEMTDWFEMYENFKSIDHTSPLVNRIHYEYFMVGRSSEGSVAASYIEKMMENKRFDQIRESQRYNAVIDRLRKLKK